MTDLATILVPKKLAWEQGVNAAVAQIFPGPADTTHDRSAIGENDAQDILNVTTANGVWELDQRYRQFAPNPTAVTDTVFVSHVLPCFMIVSHTGGAPITQCNGGTVSGSCSAGWGYNGGSGHTVCQVSPS